MAEENQVQQVTKEPQRVQQVTTKKPKESRTGYEAG